MHHALSKIITELYREWRLAEDMIVLGLNQGMGILKVVFNVRN